MGYILKTTFWLGLVYSAMPLGEVPQVTLAPASVADRALCAVASAAVTAKLGADAASYAQAASTGCAAFVAASGAIASAAQAPSHRDSLNTLTPSDRKPPWRGLRRNANS